MTEIRIRIPVDDDGFFSFECSSCGERFKLAAGEYQDQDPIRICCPLCGLSGERASFLTQDVRNAGMAAAKNLVIDELNKMSKRLSRQTRGNKNFKIRPGKRLKKEPDPELREGPDLQAVTAKCCGIQMKIDSPSTHSVLYCPYCATPHSNG